MKCKIFIGRWYEAQGAFNKWAKGKALSKSVIIHTIGIHRIAGATFEDNIAIVVYHPEGEPWEEVQQ